MRNVQSIVFGVLFLILPFTPVWADEYMQTITVFKNAGESGAYFNNSYGYAVFPTIGQGGAVIGGAHGSGRVYAGGKTTGTTTVTQLTIGFQLGGQLYSQIIFFEDKRAFTEFTNGNFEFSAQAQAVAIVVSASAEAGTAGGGQAGASATQDNATTAGAYYKGMAVFTVAKGGLMYEASVGGQKFGYTPL